MVSWGRMGNRLFLGKHFPCPLIAQKALSVIASRVIFGGCWMRLDRGHFRFRIRMANLYSIDGMAIRHIHQIGSVAYPILGGLVVVCPRNRTTGLPARPAPQHPICLHSLDRGSLCPGVAPTRMYQVYRNQIARELTSQRSKIMRVARQFSNRLRITLSLRLKAVTVLTHLLSRYHRNNRHQLPALPLKVVQ